MKVTLVMLKQQAEARRLTGVANNKQSLRAALVAFDDVASDDFWINAAKARGLETESQSVDSIKKKMRKADEENSSFPEVVDKPKPQKVTKTEE